MREIITMSQDRGNEIYLVTSFQFLIKSEESQHVSGFIQASLSKIQEQFKDF